MATYAKVFAIQSVVSALQLGLVIPKFNAIHNAEQYLCFGDTTSKQYLAFHDLKNLLDLEDGDYMDVLGTFGGKLVTEVFNFPLLDAIFYGFATLVDGSISRRDTETIEGIKAAAYNSEPENKDYIKINFGLDALVGDVVTVLNNRKIRREAKTILGAVSELQNRLVGKDEKSKTQVRNYNNRKLLFIRILILPPTGHDHAQSARGFDTSVSSGRTAYPRGKECNSTFVRSQLLQQAHSFVRYCIGHYRQKIQKGCLGKVA